MFSSLNDDLKQLKVKTALKHTFIQRFICLTPTHDLGSPVTLARMILDLGIKSVHSQTPDRKAQDNKEIETRNP